MREMWSRLMFCVVIYQIRMFSPTRCASRFTKSLDIVRYAGEHGADKGVFGYEELTFLAQRVAEWCVHYDELEYKKPEAIWLDEDPFRET